MRSTFEKWKCRNQGKIRERGHGWIKRASVSCQRAPKATFSKQVELLSRLVQSLMELSFNSAFITVFFLPGHAGRTICLFPPSVSLIWMCTVVTVRSGQHTVSVFVTSSLWFQRNSPVFKKSQVNTNKTLSYFLNRVKIKVCIIRQSVFILKKNVFRSLPLYFLQTVKYLTTREFVESCKPRCPVSSDMFKDTADRKYLWLNKLE